MRARIAATCAVASALAGALACTDLFHSTADVLDKCQIDAASCTLDFGTLSPETAEAYAEHACAWLGACESPLGQNAFGPCMVQARLAFDWSLSPNHRVKNEPHDLWACLASAGTCDAVRGCVLPGAAAACGPDSLTCLSAGTTTARIACSDGGAQVENCALWGQTCIPDSSPATCGAGPGGGLTCASDGSTGGGAPGSCDTSRVHWCGPTGEIGVDCAGNGNGRCGVFPAGGQTSWVACVPDSDGGPDAACAATLSVSCANDIATSCPAGVTETIDCEGLLQTSGSCSEAGLDPPFDWTSPCALGTPCVPDACDGGALTGCARGALFHTECTEAGLGLCRLVTAGDDSGPHAACSPP
jgi:hypothetical protein